MTTPFQRAVWVCVIFLSCSIVLFVAANRRVAYASGAEKHQRGADLFRIKGCERCHSITGVGGDRGPDLSSVGKRLGARQIKAQILKGGHGMPPFADVLTKSEVKDLAAFLTSCRTDSAPGCRQWTPDQSPK